MNLHKSATAVFGAFFALMLGVSTTFAHSRVLPGPPPPVKFTGVLSPRVDHQEKTDTLTFTVRGQEWRFHAADAKTFTGTNRLGKFILRDLFPGFLRGSGARAVLDATQNADGQPITLEGRLYVGDRRVLITSAETVDTDQAADTTTT